MKILVVDDNIDDRGLIARFVAKSPVLSDVMVVEAETGEEALEILDSQVIDCVLLDYSLPGKNGIEILENIQSRHPELPVIMSTGLACHRVAISAMKSGAADYVIKTDISAESLSQAISSAMNKKRKEAEIIKRAYVDPLTGLGNRRALHERLDYLLQRGQRSKTPFCVLVMDLDGLKLINDRHGHDAGDRVLVEAAGRFSRTLRGGDLVTRTGGDEFVALVDLTGTDGQPESESVIRRLRQVIEADMFDIGSSRVQVGISIGSSRFPASSGQAMELISMADNAMYTNKKSRKP